MLKLQAFEKITNVTMYLRIDCELELIELGLLLLPDATEESFEHDYENIYEWIYVDHIHLPHSLNVFRRHRYAGVDDYPNEDDPPDVHAAFHAKLKPGPTYFALRDRGPNPYTDSLPAWLARFIANRTKRDVFVFDVLINADRPDPEPIRIVKPKNMLPSQSKHLS